MPAAPCSSRPIAQLVHRYADLMLLLLLAAMAWWLVGLDRRVEGQGEKLQKALVDASGVSSMGQSRHEAILKRLDQIDQRLSIIDNRFYTLFGGKAGGSIP